MTQLPEDDHEQYTFDPFARHAFYYTVNQALVREVMQHLPPASSPDTSLQIIELASGTGLVTQIILEEVQRLGRTAHIICIEPSKEARDLASAHLPGNDIVFLDGDVDQLDHITQGIDLVFCCNAIHLIPQKQALIAQIASLLVPGGLFGCNTAFFVGATPPQEGSDFNFLLIRRALAWLHQHYPAIRPSRRGQTASVQWLSANEYTALINEQGLSIVASTLEDVQMPIEAVQDIGGYWLFIEGALPGVPIPIGAQALRQAAVEAAKELHLSAVPRIWLQLIAQKSPE